MYENRKLELTTVFVRMFNKKTWCVMIYLNLSTFTEFVVKCVGKNKQRNNFNLPFFNKMKRIVPIIK